MVVQNDDQTYRPLDDRTLEQLKAADHWNRGQKQVLNEIEQSQIRAQKAIRKAQREEAYDMAKDMTPRGGFEDPEMGALNVPKEDMPVQAERPYDEDEI